jgi:hypothetical protein
MRQAHTIAKRIFKTYDNIIVRKSHLHEEGWVVLVARPRVVVQMRPTVGVGGVKA